MNNFEIETETETDTDIDAQINTNHEIEGETNLTEELNKMGVEYDKLQIQLNHMKKLNDLNNDKIKKYKIMIENIILEYHKLCVKLLD